MGLIARLRTWALSRPAVLLVDVPGETTLRWAAEAELERRGWRRAATPADTDLVVVLGEPGPELAAAVDLLWSQVPEPRHRIVVRGQGDVSAELDAGLGELVRRAAGGPRGDRRPSPTSFLDEDGGMDHGGMDHGGMDHGGMDHEGMDHMHHGGEVAGLPMASTGPDRDGLELDVLEVALGPVLPGWPTGLVLRADLQGDVLVSAELAWLDADALPTGNPPEDSQCAALDRLARFLDVAGWPTAARQARRARDGLLAGTDPARAQRLARAVARRIRRSRALAWTAGGIGQVPSQDGAGEGVVDRVRRWCDSAAGQPVDERPAPSLDEAAGLLRGTEVGGARLIVASLDLPMPAPTAPERAHA
ncbi:hypothetical protein [Blastococcus litoris]|uniref:hypothetical protein n=1 Tax=Blastococcus litoris TaxID=2171622 RepID=UPI0013DF4C8C|nr:hypothetical protein [Blastococcus litoris]